ncbi:DUF6965 family protein [Bacteroides cellulosilyticus]|uniref:DUF6965 family protein n=1 Tax=Bacteroides cellulosilyticus TaxID=246787 RepID=UPI0032EF3379
MEYKYDEESVNALMKWAENAQLPKELQLSEAEKIVNLRQYVVANINDIKAHYPDEFYNPAITRLYRLKEKLEGESIQERTISDSAGQIGTPPASG